MLKPLSILSFNGLSSKTGEPSTLKKTDKAIDPILEVFCKSTPTFLNNSIDEFVRTPKGSNAAVREAAKVELALTHGSDPNLAHYDRTLFSHLSKAIIHDRPWLFQKLLSHPKIDINQSVGIGQPPLYYAIQKGNVAAFQVLLKKNTTISKEATRLAAECGQPEMVKALLDRMPEESILPEDRLLEQLAKSQQREIQSLAWSSPDVLNTQLRKILDDIDMQPGLLNEDIDIQPRLLQVRNVLLAGANPNAAFWIFPDRGDRPLHIVADYKKKQIGDQLIKLLLSMGADHSLENELDGDTPLLAAARKNNLPALKTLLQAGADPNMANRKGITPLHIAMNRHCEESVRALLDAKADPNAKDQYQRTPKQTHSWDFRSDPTLINLLNQYGARPLENETV